MTTTDHHLHNDQQLRRQWPTITPTMTNNYADNDQQLRRQWPPWQRTVSMIQIWILIIKHKFADLKHWRYPSVTWTIRTKLISWRDKKVKKIFYASNYGACPVLVKKCCGIAGELQNIRNSEWILYKITSSNDRIYTVPKVIDFPRYNMKCGGENVILRGIFHVVSCLMLYCGNLDYF